MPQMFYPEYKLAVNYNNAAGLASVESLLPAGMDVYLIAPTVRGGHDPGAFYVRGTGTWGANGFESVRWRFDVMLYGQAAWLNSTYCASQYNGQVTVRTRLEPTGSFANYNAIMRLEKPVERSEDRLYRIEPFYVTFTRMVAL